MDSPNEQEFINKVPEGYHCFICTKVLNEPVLTECCGQNFCKICLESWFQKGQKRNKTCPHCRSEDFNYIKDLRLKRDINNLKIYCPNSNQGCDKTFPYGELDAHLKTCNFVTITCTNNCGESLLRKDQKKHCQHECPRRQVMCQHCGIPGIHIEITTDHLETCPDLPLDCPRKCGTNQIKRRNLEAHEQECPMEPVQCPFFEAGCKETLKRKDLEEHTASRIQHHLQLVSTSNQARLDTLEKEHNKLKSHHKELQEKFSNLVSCVSKEIHRMNLSRGNTGTKTSLESIETVMLSSTAMLKPRLEPYCLPFTKMSNTSSSILSVYRTPSVYLQPGCKVYLKYTSWENVYPRMDNSGSLSLILEKREIDDSLFLELPNIDMELTVTDEQNSSSKKVYPGPPTHSLCSKCNPKFHLLEDPYTLIVYKEGAILTWEQSFQNNSMEFYGYITLEDHIYCDYL